MPGWVLSANVNGSEICVGPYAICATAPCDLITGNSTHATCTCRVPFDGLTIVRSSCEARSESLISTFSVLERFTSPIQPPTYTVPCTGANAAPWVQCLDAPCSTEKGAIVCNCRLNPASGYHYYGEVCPSTASEKKALCAMLRSASADNSTSHSPGSSSSTGQSHDVLGSFYGHPPSLATCET